MDDQKKVWPNSAVLRPKADRKSEKSPTWSGDGEVTCPHCQRRVTFFQDAWDKTAASGNWLSIALKVKDHQPGAGQGGQSGQRNQSGPQPGLQGRPGSQGVMPLAPGQTQTRGRVITDDDIPF